MRVAVCFQLKKAKPRSDGKFPIYVRCTLNGQRFEFATKFFIFSEMWNDSAQQITGWTEDVKILNNRLDKIVSKIHDSDIYNHVYFNRKIDSRSEKTSLRTIIFFAEDIAMHYLKHCVPPLYTNLR